MSELKVKGVIKKITEVQEGQSQAGKAWKKVNFLIETIEEYPVEAAFTVFGEEKVDNFVKFNKVGQTVEVSFNIRSREYNDRFYTDLQAWKVFTLEATEKEPVAAGDDGFHDAKNVNDDLPF